MHPDEPGGEPAYMEKPLADIARQNALTLLYSGDGRDDSTRIRQNAEIYFGQTESDGTNANQTVAAAASENLPHAWVQVISGDLSILGEDLHTADGLAIENAPEGFEITASSNSKFLLFRLS